MRPPKPKVAQPKLPHPLPLPGSGVGRQLAPNIASPISRSLGVDVSSVRIHSDAHAATASHALGARAFTVGGHVFLGQGERPTDMPLIAHEVAHTVQQQGAPRVQLWTPGSGSSHEQEAHKAAGAVVRNQPFTIQGRTQPQIQKLGLSDALDYFADKANLIPGYRMFTLLIGVNPINMAAVERTTANFLRALIELIPGGGIVTQVLDKYGVIDHAAEWIDGQVKSLGISAGSMISALKEFLDSLSWRDIFHLGDVWDRAKRIFTTPITKLIDFGATVIKGVLQFVRQAVLAPLAALAQSTPGWDLLKAVLGEDPITGDKVPRTAETLIGGFMKLIGQEEIWENIKKAHAIDRAWVWFQKALSSLVSLVTSIPDRFVAALHELDFSDFLLLPRALAKLARVFGAFVSDFFSWALNTTLDLLQIIFEVVAPGAMQYVQKAAGAFKQIVKAPLKFVGNLIAAAKLGFQNFAGNFLSHLKAGLLDWLTGSLPGIYIPKGLTLMEIFKFVMSVLGLTWENIRGKLVKAIGETAVKVLETGFDIVVKLVREGPAAAWEAIKEQLSNLKDMAIGAIQDFVIDAVVQKAIPQLLSLFIPGAGFITAILKIYDTIMVFVQRLKTIWQVVTGFIDSIAAIASGAIGGAAKLVESTLARLLSLAINFVAAFIGLGRVSDKIMGVIQKIRAPIDKALDWLIAWIVGLAKKLGKLAKSAVAGVKNWWKARKPFSGADGSSHTLFFAGEHANAVLTVASGTPTPVNKFLSSIAAAATGSADAAVRNAYKEAIAKAKLIDGLRATVEAADVSGRQTDDIDMLNKQLELLADLLKPLVPLAFPAPAQGAGASRVSVGQLIKITASNLVALVTALDEASIPGQIFVKFRIVSPRQDRSTASLATGFLASAYDKEFAVYTNDPRELYLGRTPGRDSGVGKQVRDRMMREGKLVNGKVTGRDGRQYSVAECDMGHVIDAVLWWNTTGFLTGARSGAVDEFMNNPINYEFEPSSINRARGAKLGARGITYTPPAK